MYLLKLLFILAVSLALCEALPGPDPAKVPKNKKTTVKSNARKSSSVLVRPSSSHVSATLTATAHSGKGTSMVTKTSTGKVAKPTGSKTSSGSSKVSRTATNTASVSAIASDVPSVEELMKEFPVVDNPDKMDIPYVKARDLEIADNQSDASNTAIAKRGLFDLFFGSVKLVSDSRYKCPKNWRDVADSPFFSKPPRSKSLFYANVGAQSPIEAGADISGYYMLIHRLDHKYVKWAVKNCDRKRFWLEASIAMAKTSSGTVRVLLPDVDSRGPLHFPRKSAGPSAGEKTVWESAEWPTLLRNHRVHTVIRHTTWSLVSERHPSYVLMRRE